MKKFGIILLSLLALASCERDNENHYTLKRLVSVTECDADGSNKRVGTYSYFEDGTSVSTTLDGVPERVSRTRYIGNKEIQSDSVYVEGVLQPEQTITVYYRDGYRSIVDTVIIVDPLGVEISRDEYEYEGGYYSIFTYESGVKTTWREVTNYYGNLVTKLYNWDADKNTWSFVSKEESITSYEDTMTIVNIILNDKFSEKHVYQSLGDLVEYKRYKAKGEEDWELVSYGSYKYETITI